MKHAFSHLKRWAVTPRGLILDFGAYEKEHVIVKGEQAIIDSMGRRISSCISSLCSTPPKEIASIPLEKVSPPKVNATIPLEKVSTEMTTLLELGFTDRTKNAALLAKHNNNLELVVGELLGN